MALDRAQNVTNKIEDYTTMIPLISQIKSAVQAIQGDFASAASTQDAFSKRFPVVSQARSMVELMQGNKNAAEETQVEFLEGIRNFFRPTVARAAETQKPLVSEAVDVAFKLISKDTGMILSKTLKMCKAEGGDSLHLLWYEKDGFLYNNDRTAVLDISGYSPAKAFVKTSMAVIMYAKKDSNNINQKWILGSNGLIESKVRGFFLKEVPGSVIASSLKPLTYWRIEHVALKSKEAAAQLQTRPLCTETEPKQLQHDPTTEIQKSNMAEQIKKPNYPNGTFFLRLQGKYLTKHLTLIAQPDESQGILWLCQDSFIKNLETFQVLDVCEYSPLKAMVQKKFKVILYQQKHSQNDNQKWNLKDDGVIESRIIGSFCLGFDNGQLLVAKDANKRDKWQKEFKA